MMKKIIFSFIILLFMAIGSAYSQIDTISDGESGSSVRGKLNDVIKNVNDSLVDKDSLAYYYLKTETDQLITDSTQHAIDSIINKLNNLDSLIFLGNNASEWLYGKLTLDTNEHFITFHMEKEGVKLQIGGEFFIYCRNTSGQIIENGTYVRFAGVTGEVPDIDIGGCGSSDSSLVIGATTHEFAINESGFVTEKGKLNEVDRSWSVPGYIEYLGHNGKSQVTQPTFPNVARIVGTTLRANSNGISYVYIESTPWNIPQHSIYFSGDQRIRSADTNFQYIDSINTLKVDRIESDTINLNGSYIIGTADSIWIERPLGSFIKRIDSIGDLLTGQQVKDTVSQNTLDSIATNKFKLYIAHGSDSIGLIGIWNSDCNCYIMDTLSLSRADQFSKMYIDTITKYLGNFVQFDGLIKFDSIISFSGDTTMDISYHTDSVYVVVNGKTFVFYAQGEQPYFTPVLFDLYRAGSSTLSVTQNVWTKVTNGTDDLFTEKYAINCIHQGDSVQLTSVGYYAMTFDDYWASSSGNDVWNTAIFKNDVLEPTNTSGYWSSGSSLTIIVYSDGDDWFSLRMMNQTNGNQANIGRINWSGHKISN